MSVFEDFRDEVLTELNRKMEGCRDIGSYVLDARLKMEEVVFAIKLVEEANLRKGYKVSVRDKLKSRADNVSNVSGKIAQFRLKGIREVIEVCDKCWDMVNDCCYKCIYLDEEGICMSVCGCVRAMEREYE